MEYKMVTVVAVVRNIDHSTTKFTYSLEDLTGNILGHFWIEENDSQQQHIQLNTYVRIVGALRSQNGSRSIMIFKIHPISGVNELNTHLLEVINARYLAEEYARGGGSAAKEPGLNQNNKMEVENSTSEDIDGLRGKDRAILDVIRTYNDSDVGCNRSEIIKRFSHIQPREISNILDTMIANGNIYTTLDQDHFQACF